MNLMPLYHHDFLPSIGSACPRFNGGHFCRKDAMACDAVAGESAVAGGESPPNTANDSPMTWTVPSKPLGSSSTHSSARTAAGAAVHPRVVAPELHRLSRSFDGRFEVLVELRNGRTTPSPSGAAPGTPRWWPARTI